MAKPHISQLDNSRVDEIRHIALDEGDTEGAIEMLFEDFPEASRDEVVDVLDDIERGAFPE